MLTRCFPSALCVTRPLKSVVVSETQVATFECEVSHFNVPSTWLRDGMEIEMSEKFSIVVSGKLHQLKVMNTSGDDSAEYTFVCGNDRVSAMLTVNRKPLPFLFPLPYSNTVDLKLQARRPLISFIVCWIKLIHKRMESLSNNLQPIIDSVGFSQ